MAALLKRCPFCYEEVAEIHQDKHRTWYVECNNCKARGPAYTPYNAPNAVYETSLVREDIASDAAIDSWNYR